MEKSIVQIGEMGHVPRVKVHKIGNLVYKIVHSEKEAYNMCCDYVNLIGFLEFRCARSRYREKTNKLRQKEYWCHCKSFKSHYKPGEEP